VSHPRLKAIRQLAGLEWGNYPFSAGRLVYLLKAKFGDGWRVAWYRDVIRPQILETAPTNTGAGACELHVLTSQYDWLNLLWALKTFYYYSGRSYGLCIHEDGTLDDSARQALRLAFPDARLISRIEADECLLPLLASYPRCLEFRSTNALSQKVFDFTALGTHERLMIMDSDLLFFAEPIDLLWALEHSPHNSLNKDWREGYTISQATRSKLGFQVPPLINSGLGLVHKASMRLDWLEEFLALAEILSHPHQIEQTLIALCSARFGYTMLPEEYDVHVGPRRPHAPCRHYAGPTRPLLYGEGLRVLLKQRFLAATSPLK
jgi:hypothetical protein